MLEWRELFMFTAGMLAALCIRRRWPSLNRQLPPSAWRDQPARTALPGLVIAAAIIGMATGIWLFVLIIPTGLAGIWLWTWWWRGRSSSTAP